MRLLFLILVLLNAVAFGYIRFAEGRAGADNQLPLLQIAPEKMKLVKPVAPVLPRADASRAQPKLVCLEWGSFAVEESAKAGSALEKLGVADKVSRREFAEAYWVYIPPLKTKADADKTASELKARGITDVAVMPDIGQWQFALSLGVFKTQEAANSYLGQLQQKGVRTALAGRGGLRRGTVVNCGPGGPAAGKNVPFTT